MVVYQLFGSSAAIGLRRPRRWGGHTDAALDGRCSAWRSSRCCGLDEWIVDGADAAAGSAPASRIDPAGLAGLEPAVRTWGHARWRPALSRVARAGAGPADAAEVIVHRHPASLRRCGPGLRPPHVAPPAAPGREHGGRERRHRLRAAPATAVHRLGPARRGRRDRPAPEGVGVARALRASPRTSRPCSRCTSPRRGWSAIRFTPAVAGLLPDLDVAPAQWIPRDRAAGAGRPARRDGPPVPLLPGGVLGPRSHVSPACSARPRTSGPCIWSGRHCFLPPIRESYREIDHVDDEGPVRRPCVGGASAAPPLPAGSCDLCRRLVPAHRRPDEIDPDLYGAAESLRELAAEDRAARVLPALRRRALHPGAGAGGAPRRRRVPAGQGLLGGDGARGRAHHHHQHDQRLRPRLSTARTSAIEHNTQHNHGGWPGDSSDGGGGERDDAGRRSRSVAVTFATPTSERAEHPEQLLRVGDRTIAVAALRAALDERGDRVVALGRTADERVALRHEIAATRRELATDEPDGVAVRVRWQAVLAILGDDSGDERGRRADYAVRHGPVRPMTSCARCGTALLTGRRLLHAVQPNPPSGRPRGPGGGIAAPAVVVGVIALLAAGGAVGVVSSWPQPAEVSASVAEGDTSPSPGVSTLARDARVLRRVDPPPSPEPRSPPRSRRTGQRPRRPSATGCHRSPRSPSAWRPNGGVYDSGPGSSTNSRDVNSWCATNGFSPDGCFAKRLSHTETPDGNTLH